MGWGGWFEGPKHKSIKGTFVQPGVGVCRKKVLLYTNFHKNSQKIAKNRKKV